MLCALAFTDGTTKPYTTKWSGRVTEKSVPSPFEFRNGVAKKKNHNIISEQRVLHRELETIPKGKINGARPSAV